MSYFKTQSKTGQLLKSNIKNCPIYIPAKLNDELINSLLCTNHSLNVNLNKYQLDDSFKLYFYKFFAGNNSLNEKCADIPVENLYLWKDAKIAIKPQIKPLVNDIIKFKKTLNLMSMSHTLTMTDIIWWNKEIIPKKTQYGIRKQKMLVGDPKKVTFAFFAAPSKMLSDLCDDTVKFINSKQINVIDRALISMMQFFFIHPFLDGNGRIFRALSITILQKHFGLLNAFILNLYFKNINKGEYYLSQKKYRQGDVHAIVDFHKKAINWTNKSAKVLKNLIDDYIFSIEKDDFIKNVNYKQIIVKINKYKSHDLDTNTFHFIQNKGQNAIYLNSALLNVM